MVGNLSGQYASQNYSSRFPFIREDSSYQGFRIAEHLEASRVRKTFNQSIQLFLSCLKWACLYESVYLIYVVGLCPHGAVCYHESMSLVRSLTFRSLGRRGEGVGLRAEKARTKARHELIFLFFVFGLFLFFLFLCYFFLSLSLISMYA